MCGGADKTVVKNNLEIINLNNGIEPLPKACLFGNLKKSTRLLSREMRYILEISYATGCGLIAK